MGRGKHLSPEDVQRLRVAVADGHGPAFIARKYGWRPDSCKRWVAKLKRGEALRKERKGIKEWSHFKLTDEVVEKARHFVENDPKNASVKKLAAHLGVGRTCARRCLKEKLWMKALKQVRVQKVSDGNKQKRLHFAEHTLARLAAVGGRMRMRGKTPPPLDLARLVFTDEKMFRFESAAEGGTSMQNRRVWVDANLRKADVKPADIVREGPSSKHGVMVACGMSKAGGLFHPFFVNARAKIDSSYYCDMIDQYYVPQSVAVLGNDWVLQQDNAPSHVSRMSMVHIEGVVPSVLQWPASSPDMSPLDYWLWNRLVTLIHEEAAQVKNDADLRGAIVRACQKVKPEEIAAAVDSFPLRLRACVAAKGGQFEYTLKRKKTDSVSAAAVVDE